MDENAELSCDQLGRTGLHLWQARDGYRFSLDPFLLTAFACTQRPGPWHTLADLGSGNGVLPLLVAQAGMAVKIYGLERQAGMVQRARRNVGENGYTGVIEIREEDVRSTALPAGSCEVVMTNPPFRIPGQGRLAAGSERAAARHELYGGLNHFAGAAARLLERQGDLFLVHLPERLPDLFVALAAAELTPLTLRTVHGRSGDGARLILLQARKGSRGTLQVLPPLLIYAGEHYHPEVEALYGQEGAPAAG